MKMEGIKYARKLMTMLMVDWYNHQLLVMFRKPLRGMVSLKILRLPYIFRDIRAYIIDLKTFRRAIQEICIVDFDFNRSQYMK